MQNLIKITIPKPCHEDWNKMTPNEQGSFCGKCCKTVVDFSNKTPEEITKTLLEKKAEKVCGRFMNKQIERPLANSLSLKIPLYLLPKNISYQRAFAIALFFVFGTGLFSCVTPENHTVGELRFEDTTGTIVDSTNYITGDTTYSVIDKNEAIKGELESEMLKGDVIMEFKKDKLGQENSCEPKSTYEKRVQGQVAVVTTDTLKKDTLKRTKTMGKISISK